MIPISDSLYAAFIGPNWGSHYKDAFARIEEDRGRGLTRSWNSAAALVPFWFVYRGLTSWSVIFFLATFVLYVVYATAFVVFSWMRYELSWLPFVPAYISASLVQGVVADTLLYRLALRRINAVRRKASDQASALRALRAMAPKNAPGVYVSHGLLMAVGIPVWAIAARFGTMALAPQYSDPQSVYIALMRTALRDLVVAQETHFAETTRYSDDLSLLRYEPPQGVLLRVTSASDSGWSASASHAMVSQPCTIFIGRGAPQGNAEEGVPRCP